MRGRKPKPTTLHTLHGNPSKAAKKARIHEPIPPTGNLDDPPDWLSASQQAGWRYAMEHCPAGLLSRIDRGVLAVWVVAEDLHRQAVIAQTKIGGLVSKLKDTQTFIQSPYLPIINRQGVMMIKAAGELGFSPVSRPRIGAPAAPLPLTPAPERTPLHGRREKPRLSLDAYLDTHPDRKTLN